MAELHKKDAIDTLELTSDLGSFALVAPTGTFTRQRGDVADPARLMVVSDGRYGLEVEFNTRSSVRAYLESWYVNDAESAAGQQLVDGVCEIETETLELVLARTLPTYRVGYKPGTSTFQVDNRRFDMQRSGDRAAVVDVLTDTPIFIGVVSDDLEDIVAAFEGAIDGRCRGLSS
ncbi:hypothetical protein ACFSYH_12610 [Populibacterium corticicola]|uniref:Uncharacterized protein n=1 Tax=Populibacterium corticicola TaxID=1812826 RepID=A0ABW5XI78_9MICO